MTLLNDAINDLLDVLIEEEICDIVNETGHDHLFGKDEEITVDEVEPDLESVNSMNVDIFGQVLGKKATFEIQCPNCKRTLAAVRFAPHLEKCMGMGRNSSRIASRRLAAAAGNNSGSNFASSSDGQRVTVPGQASLTTSSSAVVQVANNNCDNVSDDDHFEDVDDDEDWTMEKKRRSKRPIEKSASRRQKDTRSHLYDKE